MGYFLQGLLCFTGAGGNYDPKSAFRYFSMNGDALAESHLGEMYEVGLGTRKDPVETRTWYRRAAEHGHKGAEVRNETLAQKVDE